MSVNNLAGLPIRAQIVALQNELIEVRRENGAVRQEFAALEQKVQALVDMMVKSHDYIEFLRERVAKKIAARQGAK